MLQKLYINIMLLYCLFIFENISVDSSSAFKGPSWISQGESQR